jgi:hypothetical protein
VDRIDSQSADPGRIAYEAYGRQVGWLAYNGQPMPNWTELPERIRIAWQAAARAAIERSVRS